jgi:hypothetical protein
VKEINVVCNVAHQKRIQDTVEILCSSLRHLLFVLLLNGIRGYVP